MNDFEMLAAEAYDEGLVSEVIRPAAVLPEQAARSVLVELALRDINAGGAWHADPNRWRRFEESVAEHPSASLPELLGTIQVAYGTPTRYEITIYRATITRAGTERGWTVESLCEEALSYGGLTLATCPRADLKPPPKPFRY